jgi:hypothetical protein
MLVPGWPQIHSGYPRRGFAFLGAYAACLLLALPFVGTVIGGLFLGLALSCHGSSVLDVIYSGTREWRTRIAYSLLCFTILGLCVYYPLSRFWLIR